MKRRSYLIAATGTATILTGCAAQQPSFDGNDTNCTDDEILDDKDSVEPGHSFELKYTSRMLTLDGESVQNCDHFKI